MHKSQNSSRFCIWWFDRLSGHGQQNMCTYIHTISTVNAHCTAQGPVDIFQTVWEINMQVDLKPGREHADLTEQYYKAAKACRAAWTIFQATTPHQQPALCLSLWQVANVAALPIDWFSHSTASSGQQPTILCLWWTSLSQTSISLHHLQFVVTLMFSTFR